MCLFFKCTNTRVESSEKVNFLHTSSPEAGECFLIVPRSTYSIEGISWGVTIQYLVCPPWLLTIGTNLLYMEWIRCLIKAIGIAAHILRKATLRSAAVIGLGRTSLSFLWISSHKCSIGFKSGLRAGHSMIMMLCCWRKSLVALASWARAVSCWNMWCWWRPKCEPWPTWANILKDNTFSLIPMAPQTMMLCPPHASA